MEFENEIKCISLEGFQLVKNKFFSRSSEPVMSLFPSAISFNVASHEALNRCESVEILVNEEKHSILVKPAVSGKESEAIKWRKNTTKPQYSRVECSLFAKKIYAGADFLLNLASVEPCGLCPLIANKYGSLPIVYATGGIKDNVKDFKQENGNGYVFNDYDINSLKDLFNRAIYDFKNKDKMKSYILSGMNQKFDVIDCAKKYIDLYYEM